MSPDLYDLPSLQRGLRLYVDYCMGCHSLQYQRYERTADDLGIPHDIFTEELIFTGQQIGGLMQNAMPEQAADWFGVAPPDLTNVARIRGDDWLYSYLKTFYADPNRPLGVNNLVFPNVGMPHALLELQGVVSIGCDMVAQSAAGEAAQAQHRDPLNPDREVLVEDCDRPVLEAGSGLLTPEEYDQAVYDIVNFLYYVGDPNRLERYRIGVYGLLFLVILFVLTHLLAREYRKEMH